MLADLISKSEFLREDRVARATRKANDKLRRTFIRRIGRDVWDALEDRHQGGDVAIHFTYGGKAWRIEPHALNTLNLMPDAPKPSFYSRSWLTWTSNISNREDFLHALKERAE